MEVARIEKEMAALRLVVANDDGRVAGGKRGSETRRRKAAIGMDCDLEAIKRIIGRIGDDFGGDPRDGLQGAEPQIKRLALSLADASAGAFASF